MARHLFVAPRGFWLSAFRNPLLRSAPKVVAPVHEALVGLAEMLRVLARANLVRDDAAGVALTCQKPGVCAYYPSRHHPVAKVRAFVEFILDAFALIDINAWLTSAFGALRHLPLVCSWMSC